MYHAGIDHCAQEDHGCEQLCLNTEESFVCQCSEGFLINDDLKTCSRESPSSFLLRHRFARGVKRTCDCTAMGMDVASFPWL